MRRTKEPDIGARIAGLRDAVDALDRLPPDLLPTQAPRERANAVLQQVGQRRALSAEHTVVALAGATGSGKSSLTNALSGTDAATVGARRPTTADPLAVVWDGEGVEAAGARPLLDWLGVGRRHEVQVPPSTTRAEAASGHSAGLVLLDLPDIDSVRVENRRRATQLAGTVDALVWVLDPQKYADDVVHTQFLRPMVRHAAVTVVALNQIDRLPEADRAPVLADLRRRLADDGLGSVLVLGVSARTGEGLDELRSRIGELVLRRRSSDARLAADVATAADALAQAYPTGEVAAVGEAQVRRLVDALAVAAGVERVADAVGGSFRFRARAQTGWPPLRWLGRFRPDPLRRLHLGRGAPGGGEPDRSDRTDRPDVTPTSLPTASPAAQAQVGTALRDLGATVAEKAAEPWRSYLRDGVTDRADDLPDELDRVIARAPLPGRTDPRWFRVNGVLQWLALATALAGGLWLALYAVLGYLRLEVTWVPQVGPVPADPPLPELPAIPWPTLLLVTGVVVGLLLALVCRLAAGAGARRRTRATRTLLRRQVRERVDKLVLTRLRERAEVARTFAAGVDVAGR